MGVMISASHNPFYDNGIKLFGPDGFKLSDAKESTIEDLMQGGDIQLAAPEKVCVPAVLRMHADAISSL